MHHLYPLAKGDPLCPLGFHPQVRWPTRCKRCFRDYKEHGGKKKDDDSLLRRDDSTSSSPNLSTWGSVRSTEHRRSWSSSSSLAPEQDSRNSTKNSTDFGSPASWTSTPDLANLEDSTQANIPTVSLTLPKRKQLPIDRGHRTVSDSFSLLTREKSPVFNKSDSLATRAKKLQAIKEASQERSRRIQVKELKASIDENTNHDVQFLIQVKSKTKQEKTVTDGTESEDDTISVAGTETTDTTLVGDQHDNDLQEQVDSMKKELDTMRSKCERLERDKSDFLLRRLASMETTTSKTTATEVLKLQQKCNELQSQLEDVKDDKKSLSLRVKELEEEVETRPTAQAAQKIADELRSKLLAAETLCEELMDENEDMKKELRDLEEEMEELQDNFREDQANEYTSLKKELEQTTKNCRILSFKLRKTERKTEQLEVEKGETEKKLKEVSGGVHNSEKLKQLEQDLKISNEASLRLQKELDEYKTKLCKLEESSNKKKAPMLGNIAKVPSAEGKVSRESLTRGGSQDDPVQLLRDLQDSLEREADLREQLKFAEEEAQNLRKKASRIEDDNESLVLQLKKMATKAKSRKASPNRLTPEPSTEKDEGISEEDDPAELKLLLELNEQEASVLRKKVEELQVEKETQRKKIKDLQDKLTAKAAKKSLLGVVKGNDAQDQKIKFLEEETNELRMKLTEKEKEADRLNAELNLNQKRAKGIQKSKSFDVIDQQTVDLKRQLQSIEQEASVLRTKVQSLESENEKLASESKRLQLLRGTKTMKGDKSGEKYIDRIAELEVELEYANKKIKELEEKSEKPEKPLPDSKLKPSEKADIEKLKLQLSKIENERDKLSDTLKKLKEGAAKSFKDRSPKKPSDFTSKVQLKNMVNDLENEIGEMLVVINNYENTKSKLEDELKQTKSHSKNSELEIALKELEEIRKKVSAVEKELQNEKLKTAQEKGKYDDLNNTLTKTKENLSTNIEEKKQLHNELTAIKDKHHNLSSEKGKLETEIEKLKSEIKKTAVKHDELSTYKQLTESLKTDLSKKEKEYNSVKKDLEEKEKTIKQFNEKTKKLEDLEKQLRESEEKIKKNEKQNKEQVKQLSAKLEEERDKSRLKDSEQTELSIKWSADRKVFDLQIDELNSKIKSLENIISSKNTLIGQLEESVKKERESTSHVNTTANHKEINSLRDELNRSKANLAEVESKLEAANKSKKTAEEKLKKIENDFKKEKLALEKKVGELDIDLQNERKKLEIMKANHEKEHKNREMELSTLRNKIKTLEMNSSTGNKKTTEIRQEYQERIDKLEAALASEKQEYEDLTAKYEILEEEHVVIKAKLVMEKETLANQLLSAKRDLENAETELEELKDTYNSKNETLMKEKMQLQEKIKSIQKESDSFGLEKGRLKASLEEKVSQLEQIKKEYDVIHDQLEYMRRENDDLKKKLDDYDRVSKIQRNISADSSAMEKEIKQLRVKLSHAEKSRKSDVAECKMRYDSQVVVINDEIRSLQGQVTRFKRERDTYKHMLEGAQKTIGDLKTTPATRRESRASIASFDEIEESRSKIATLEQQISCMEDELSEARLEASKLKTELVSERSSWEIKLSELHSRVNELEEEKILSSGRTKIPGLKTRMELAWHKEREEQQRLLQETSTLARDLRQTLFEVERERDKERLESKRKQEQLKKTLEEDQEENRRKLTELQCDLLELRDAHAKLRTTNEKLRREKERHEREREEMKSLITGRKRAEQEDDRRMNAMLEQVETLIRLAPELVAGSREGTVEKEPYTPTPPRRTKGPKSRESSPALENKDSNKESSVSREDRKGQIQSVMSRLNEVTNELRRYQRLNEENRERERIKRSMGMRRATSTEHDNIPDTTRPTKEFVRNGNTSSSLHRRSLSLEHTIQQEQSIWKNDDDSLSSLQSIDGVSDIDARWSRRDTSLDSRLSGGSTQSDTGERKKTGLMGKLKKLTKSRSIDDQDPGHFSPTRALSSKPNSNSDVNEEGRGSKKDLRERITGIFKRAGSSSRSNSLERQRQDTSSTQRPLMPNGSNSNISRTSPVPEKISKVSTKTKTLKHK